MGAGERTKLLGASFVLSCGGSSRFGVMYQLPEDFFESALINWPQSHPNARATRARPLFFVFCLHLFTIRL